MNGGRRDGTWSVREIKLAFIALYFFSLAAFTGCFQVLDMAIIDRLARQSPAWALSYSISLVALGFVAFSLVLLDVAKRSTLSQGRRLVWMAVILFCWPSVFLYLLFHRRRARPDTVV